MITIQYPIMSNYEETARMIRELPQTWCPAILKLLVEVCEEKKVFRPGRIAAFVAGQESYIEGRGWDNQPIRPDGSNAEHYQWAGEPEPLPGHLGADAPLVPEEGGK